MAGNRFDTPVIKIARNATRFSHGSMFTSRCSREEFVQVIGHTLSTGYLS
jgi:hypothetical protein